MRAKEFFSLKEESTRPEGLELMAFKKNDPNRDPDAVRHLQRALIALGFNVGPTKDDGMFGPNTEAAIRAFQHRNNLPITGEPNDETVDLIAKKVFSLPKDLKKDKKPEAPKEKPVVGTDTKKPEKKPGSDVKKNKVDKVYQLPTLPQSSVTGGKIGLLFDFIAKYESNGYYDIMNGGKRVPQILDMTIQDINKFQTEWSKQPKTSSAAGRYQIMGFNMIPYAVRSGLDVRTDKFTPENQDKMCLTFLREIGVSIWLNGKMSDESFLKRLHNIWAALPNPITGLSRYQDVAGNKALVSAEEALAVLKLIKTSKA